MKFGKHNINVLLILSAALPVFIMSCNKNNASVKTECTTLAATEITEHTAQLNGNVVAGQEAQCCFYYSLENMVADSLKVYGISLSAGTVISGGGDFSYRLVELVADTTYYYVASAEVAGENVLGEVLSFSTGELPVEALTGESSEITVGSAILQGKCVMEIVPGAEPLSGVEVSTSADMSKVEKTVEADSLDTAQCFICPVYSLKKGTQYYWRAYVSYKGKTHYGEIKSFTTSAEYDLGKVGEPLPAWQVSLFDIHAVNSGAGECTFIVMPDGTTMVIDAGEITNPSKYFSVPRRPDSKTRPYITYANYIKAYKPYDCEAIDYFNLSHYHQDHAGHPKPAAGGAKTDKEGRYLIVGMTGLYNEFPFRKLIDRSYPNLADSQLGTESNMDMSFYRTFVNYHVGKGHMTAEKAQVGSTSQVVLVNNPGEYPDFKVQCVGSDGYGWDGTKAVNCQDAYENARSVCWLFSYGKFDYFTSGDMNQENECRVVAQGIGRKIEAMKSHHHMSNPGTFAVEDSFYQPQVVVSQSFYVRPNQPHQQIISSCAPYQDMFFTNIDFNIIAEEGSTVGGVKNKPLDQSMYGNVTDRNGHVVIRYFPEKEQFYVYMLDDTDTLHKIKSIYGPYTCY